ncbi:hypothetical protein ACTXJX_14940 [Glutamicibacter ardleyensis]|uniref:hypothetical protein n=1 Tax=Glutamicibacter ardleyensis TaxID=225894 RepID=UPI003FCF8A33
MAKKTKARKINEGKLPRWDQTTHDMRADVGGMEIIRKKKLKRYRRYVKASVVLFPLTLVLFVVFLMLNFQEPEQKSSAVASVDSPTKATASSAMTAWLEGSPSPLPGGALIGWDGVISSLQPQVVKENGEETEQAGLETHQFTVRAKSGQLFHSTVQVTWTDALGTTVVGAPSLEPIMRDNEATAIDMVQVWPGHKVTSAPDGVEPAIDVWLQSYVSGDSNKIRLAIKDPIQEHNYFPLTQVSKATVGDITHFAPKPDDSKQGLARVNVSIIWDGTPIDTVNQEFIGGETTQAFDVLLQDVDTASPTVVAWGGTGTGQDLTPYKNAFEDRVLDLKSAPFFSEDEVNQRMKASIDQFNKSGGGNNSAVAPKKKEG